MSRTSRVLAGIAGFAVAFLFVMIVTALSPQGQPEGGTVALHYDDFAFQRDAIETVEGATLQIVNDGPVPVTFHVRAPDGENVSIELPAGAMENVTLAQEGAYTVTASPYGWASAEVDVRTANPFVRFFEDVF